MSQQIAGLCLFINNVKAQIYNVKKIHPFMSSLCIP